MNRLNYSFIGFERVIEEASPISAQDTSDDHNHYGKDDGKDSARPIAHYHCRNLPLPLWEHVLVSPSQFPATKIAFENTGNCIFVRFQNGAHSGVNHYACNPMSLARDRQQHAEHAVRRLGLRGDDQHVALGGTAQGHGRLSSCAGICGTGKKYENGMT
jgi:hypothetical protein